MSERCARRAQLERRCFSRLRAVRAVACEKHAVSAAHVKNAAALFACELQTRK
jgi:hypothetical protein